MDLIQNRLIKIPAAFIGLWIRPCAGSGDRRGATPLCLRKGCGVFSSYLGSLGGSCRWYQPGSKHVSYAFVKTNFFFFLKIIWYKYFCHSFCPTACLQTICRSLARLALGTCGQTLDSILIDACSCKLLLPQNARVKLSLATENFPSIWGGQVAVTTWFTEAHPTRVC